MSVDAHGVVVQRSSSERVRAALVAENWLDLSLKPRILPDGFIALAVVEKAVEEAKNSPNALISGNIQSLCFDQARKATQSKAPKDILRRLVLQLLVDRAIPLKYGDVDITNEIPHKWEMHGDLVLLAGNSFMHSAWKSLGQELWLTVSRALKVNKVARKASIDPGLKRESRVILLAGDTGWVEHIDNGIKYHYDVTKCMFSTGNITEKLRVASFDCENEVVVDLYAGIGYFTLPYLVKAKVKHLHACEWNSNAVYALRKNLIANGVSDRCTVYEGDNAEVAPVEVANRVNLGLIPSSEKGWPVACRCLVRNSIGILHVHDNVSVPLRSARSQDDAANQISDREWMQQTFEERARGITRTLVSLLSEHDDRGDWTVDCTHIENVKSYAPRIFHVVFDFRCVPP